MTTCDEIETDKRGARPSLIRLVLFFVMQGVAVILVGFAALFLSFEPVWSAERASAAFVKPGDARSGSLLLKTRGRLRRCIAARHRCRSHRIGSDGPRPRHPDFPQPDQGLGRGGLCLSAAVGRRGRHAEDGDRRPRRGRRHQGAAAGARSSTSRRKQNGQKAALTEQERPNIFTNSVANIGPGETVLVQIEYQEPVQQSGNEFSLRVPMVVAPRYNPAPVVQSVDFRPDGGGWGATKSDPVPDRDRISPEVLDPATNAPVNPTSITVRLQAGFPLGEVKSHHHAVKTEKPDASTSIIRLAEGPVPADRDFELTWKPAAEKAPSVGLFRERVGDSDYLLAFVTPPSVEQAQQKPLPREVIFVIDNSGSMGGVSIIQAKASLTYALGRLQPNDRFNVIRFDHTMDVLFPAAVPADREHIGRATSFVDALQANGGTEMVPAMRAALSDNASDAGYVRQVVFLTDGAIGNEQQLFETINALRGRSRIFMVGIGSAPNTYLMTRAAELGRGTFTHIGSVEQVEERMRGLFAKLENPAVTNLTAKFSDATADITPVAIPDVYRDEPLVLAAKLDKLSGLGRDQGPHRRPSLGRHPAAGECRRRQGPVQTLGAAQDRGCRSRAHHAAGEPGRSRQDHSGAGARASARHAADQPGRGRQDAEPSRKAQPLKLTELPINLPAGWDFEKVFGERPRAPVTPTERRADAEQAQVQVAALKRVQPIVTQAPSTVTLPRTATDAELKMIAGVILLTVSLILLRVHSTSDVTALTSAEKRRLPTPLSERARLPPSPKAARAAFSPQRHCLRQTRSVCTRERSDDAIHSFFSGEIDCFASLVMTREPK